jgi:hypothetical protein
MKLFKWIRNLFPKRTCGCYLDAVTGVQMDPACKEKNEKAQEERSKIGMPG